MPPFPKKGTKEYERIINTPKYIEFRERQSKRMAGRVPWNKGRTGVYTDEAIEGNRIAHIGIKNVNFGGKNHTYRMRLKLVETLNGGIWYGNVPNDRRVHYCELWVPNLLTRIDIAQNYRSILSNKTKEDNKDHNGKPRSLTRHHVYWQPKACCEWDEDAQGYYAWINIESKRKPNWYKYYIDGDPNKFVLLTDSEHGMIKRDKLKWIKIFEELIKTNLNGKCYLTKEEYRERCKK